MWPGGPIADMVVSLLGKGIYVDAPSIGAQIDPLRIFFAPSLGRYVAQLFPCLVVCPDCALIDKRREREECFFLEALRASCGPCLYSPKRGSGKEIVNQRFLATRIISWPFLPLTHGRMRNICPYMFTLLMSCLPVPLSGVIF